MLSKILLDWCCKCKRREMRHPSKTQWLNLLWWPFLLADNFWCWFQSRKLKFQWWERWIKSKWSSKSYSSCYWDRTSRADWSPHKMFRNVSFLKVLLQFALLVLFYSSFVNRINCSIQRNWKKCLFIWQWVLSMPT